MKLPQTFSSAAQIPIGLFKLVLNKLFKYLICLNTQTFQIFFYFYNFLIIFLEHWNQFYLNFGKLFMRKCDSLSKWERHSKFVQYSF